MAALLPSNDRASICTPYENSFIFITVCWFGFFFFMDFPTNAMDDQDDGADHDDDDDVDGICQCTQLSSDANYPSMYIHTYYYMYISNHVQRYLAKEVVNHSGGGCPLGCDLYHGTGN